MSYMPYFPGYTRPDELYHYGVKGMKWGVRRYQDYDGSYTKKGLERFRKSEAKYDNAKAAYESYKSYGNEIGARVAKRDMRSAKREMSRDYEQLKLGKLADEGKELYKQGMTVTKNDQKRAYAELAGFVGGIAAANAVARVTNNYSMGVAAFVTAAAVEAGYDIMMYNRNKKLRAYYANNPSVAPN